MGSPDRQEDPHTPGQTDGQKAFLSVELGRAHPEERVQLMAESLPHMIENPALKARYQRQNLSTAERLEALHHLPPAEQLHFVQTMCTVALESGAAFSEVQKLLPYLCRPLEANQRAKLISALLQHSEQDAAHDLTALVMRESEDISMLHGIVSQCTPKQLCSTRHAGVIDLVARARLGNRFQQIMLPYPLHSSASPQQILAAANQVAQKAALMRKAILRETPSRFTPSAKSYMRIVNQAFARVQQAHILSTSPEASRERVNAAIFALRLGARYGINFCDGGEGKASNHAQWRSEELQVIEAHLSQLPEGRLSFTPLLEDIQRLHSLGSNTLANRDDDGTISISDEAFSTNPIYAYEGIPEFVAVLIHELGHAIQHGDSFNPEVISELEILDNPGDLRYDPEGFMELSNWRVYPAERYTVDEEDQTVVLDGSPYPLNEQLLIDGQSLVLRYYPHDEILFSYASDAAFPRRDYSRHSPWEDWCECFVDYLLAPDQLRQDAADKFSYFERLFRTHNGGRNVQNAVRERIKPDKKEDDDGWTTSRTRKAA